MKSIQKGFTLIELMITVAIVAILATIAIPMYQDYSIRARVAEGMHVVAATKTAVAETFQSQAFFPSSNSAAGVPATISSTNIDSILVSNNGEITVTFDATEVGVADDENTLTLVPTAANGVVSWDCTGGSLLDRYRPANCR